MVKKLPDGRTWVETKVTEKEYQSLLDAMCHAGAPDLSAFLHWCVVSEVAKDLGEPVPPMPWKEQCTPVLAVRPWHGALSTPMQSNAMPYSPARRYDTPADGIRARLRQMVAVKRQIELELIDYAERELMRE